MLIYLKPKNYYEGTEYERSTEHADVSIDDNGLEFYATDTGILYRVCGGAWLAVSIGSGGAESFLELSDTPATYSGQANKYVKVNAGETALEFVTFVGIPEPDDDATVYGRMTDGTSSWVEVVPASGGEYSGNVGFGIAPSYPIHTLGEVRHQFASGNHWIAFTDSGSATSRMAARDPTDTLGQLDISGSALSLRVGSTGIGTNAIRALDVSGTTRIGFFNTTPVARPNAVTARVALQNLGLATSLTFEGIPEPANDSVPYLRRTVAGTSSWIAGVPATGGTFSGATAVSSGGLTVEGGAIFNEAGAAVVHRFEGDTDANLLYIDGPNDRVGIGIGVPEQKLHINGRILADGISEGTYANIGVNVDNTTSSATTDVIHLRNGLTRWVMRSTGEETGSNAGTNLSIIPYNDAGTSLGSAINISRATGNVGIGTPTPTSKLHVTHTTGAAGIELFRAESANESGYFSVKDGASSGFLPLFEFKSGSISIGGAFNALVGTDTQNNALSAFLFSARNSAGTGALSNCDLFQVDNYTTTAFKIWNNGRISNTATPPNAMLFIDQPSTTGAVAVLDLDQADLSEEFINFISSVGAGNPIDTAAIGTYYGKIRVAVNGTFKYIALYNS